MQVPEILERIRLGEILFNSQIGDINPEAVYAFLERDNPLIADELRQGALELTTVLENLELVRQGHLTLAGNLVFGKLPQKYTPSFYVDCVHFDGNEVGVASFIAKATIKGSLLQQYEGSMHFIRHNLKRIPLTEGFNAQTTLEIDERVVAELLVNALVHRDYHIQSSVKVFVFHDRLEIISPGKLTNSLTVDKIKAGLAIHRNPVLSSICKSILPYSGYGSGIKRALHLKPDLELVDDREKEEFRCVIPRRSLHSPAT